MESFPFEMAKAEIESAFCEPLSDLFADLRADAILVQGDTTTAFVGALAGFYKRVKVAHIEAGLRSFNKYSPFPEEINRSLVGRLVNFSATAAQALLGTDFRVTTNRGKVIPSPLFARVLATIHPSAILRQPTSEAREREMLHLIADLEVAAGLLHDTVEDTPITLEDIQADFGPEIALLVDGVTKLTQLPRVSRGDQHPEREAEEEQERQIAERRGLPDPDEQAEQISRSRRYDLVSETLRKTFLAMGEDVRVVLIKLADRLHNMRTLEHMKPESRRRVSEETLEIYAPLAGRMGMQTLREELEQLAFKWGQPDAYKTVFDKLDDIHKRNAGLVEAVHVVDVAVGLLRDAALRLAHQRLALAEQRGPGRAHAGAGGRLALGEPRRAQHALTDHRHRPVPLVLRHPERTGHDAVAAADAQLRVVDDRPRRHHGVERHLGHGDAGLRVEEHLDRRARGTGEDQQLVDDAVHAQERHPGDGADQRRRPERDNEGHEQRQPPARAFDLHHQEIGDPQDDEDQRETAAAEDHPAKIGVQFGALRRSRDLRLAADVAAQADARDRPPRRRLE